ncbi:Peptidoglycan/xylan/chitin deacetylase (PgdA/CDA1 family) OS=Streptomyces albaduncus OX=68172 GN=FHS32_006524 PE=4 SV=1 [Streptomyces griseoloalbus]
MIILRFHDTSMDRKSEAYQSKEILDAKRLITRRPAASAPSTTGPPAGRSPSAQPRGRRLPRQCPPGWNVDTKDFEQPGADHRRDRAAGAVQRLRSFLHDAGGYCAQTVEALARRALLLALKEEGYSFGFPVR